MNQLFNADTSTKFQSLCTDLSKENTMLWMPARDGKFSVKSTYNMLIKSNREVQVNGSTINLAVWESLINAAHMIKLFAWKCIRDLNITRSKQALYIVVSAGIMKRQSAGIPLRMKNGYTR